MHDFVYGGWIADLALLALAVEAAALWRIGPRDRARARLAAAAPFLVAGAGLLLALRAALVEAPWYCVATALTLAGAASAVDLARRLKA